MMGDEGGLQRGGEPDAAREAEASLRAGESMPAGESLSALRGLEAEGDGASAELEILRRQFESLSSRLAEDLRLAGKVQRGLQPGPVHHPRLDLAREFIPFREVGGDYYDVVMLERDRVALAIGDVMGKGIPAALLAATLTATVRSQIQSGQWLPEGVVAHVNRLFWQVSPPGLFASLFYAVLDLQTGALEYVNAGHHYPFVLRVNGDPGDAIELADGGTVLGLIEDACFSRGHLRLHPADLLVLYSDGITERTNPEGELYGLERLERAALLSRSDPARICLYSILGDIQGWSRGTPAEDDATLIVARIRS